AILQGQDATVTSIFATVNELPRDVAAVSSGVSFLDGPQGLGLSPRTVATLEPGAEVEVLGTAMEGVDQLDYFVRWRGRTGWIADNARYLVLRFGRELSAPRRFAGLVSVDASRDAFVTLDRTTTTIRIADAKGFRQALAAAPGLRISGTASRNALGS